MKLADKIGAAFSVTTGVVVAILFFLAQQWVLGIAALLYYVLVVALIYRYIVR